MNLHLRPGAALVSALLWVWVSSPGFAQGREPSTNLTFAAGLVTCTVVSPSEAAAATVRDTLPIAMRAAVDQAGAPERPAHLTIHVLPPPSFYKRLKALFKVEAFAMQAGDEIRLYPGNDPLKLAFRLGHELAHWLVVQRYPARPPLWLDEGLAQLSGSAAADTRARTLKQDLARPVPEGLEGYLFSLDELTALRDYPRSQNGSAAFYWQAEALAGAIQRRLGAKEFQTFVGLIALPEPPDWRVPLRERWYFSDWDMDWLAGQIRPSPVQDIP